MIQVVGLEAGAVVGDPVLGEVVGADALGAVDRAHLRLATGGRLSGLLLLLERNQARAQDAHGLLLVLQLRLLVLTAHHDPGRKVGDPHGGIGGVDTLTAGTRGAVDVNTQVIRVDRHFDVLSLGEDQDTRRGGMNPAL